MESGTPEEMVEAAIVKAARASGTEVASMAVRRAAEIVVVRGVVDVSYACPSDFTFYLKKRWFVVESVANGRTASLGYSDRSARPDGFAGVPSAAAACAELFPQFGARPQYRTVLSEHQDDVRAQLQEEVSYPCMQIPMAWSSTSGEAAVDPE